MIHDIDPTGTLIAIESELAHRRSVASHRRLRRLAARSARKRSGRT